MEENPNQKNEEIIEEKPQKIKKWLTIIIDSKVHRKNLEHGKRITKTYGNQQAKYNIRKFI